MIIADNLRITDPIIAEAVEKFNPGPIRETVLRCVAAGADGIDINSGPLTQEPERRMKFLVETVQETCDLPVLIDTANPIAMAAGLGANRKKAMINAFSLEPKKVEFILPLAKKFHVDIIGYLLYPNGHVPPDETERLTTAISLLSALETAGIDRNRLVIDPIIPPITWQDAQVQAMGILSVIRNIPDVLGFPVRTIAALSNLTSARGPSRDKRLLERSYLPMLYSAGLTMIMMNMYHEENVRVAKMCAALRDSKIFCWQGF